MARDRSNIYETLSTATDILIEEASPRRSLPSLTTGFITGLMQVIMSVSFAALIFSGPFSDFIPTGVAILLFSNVVLVVVIGLLASEGGTISTIQDSVAAVLALISAGIAATLPAGASAEAGFATVVVAMALGSLLTGLVFLALGTFRLGELIRYIPYPVIGGFLAGTGWVLTAGALGVMLGTSVGMTELPQLFAADSLLLWLPGVGFAVLLLLAQRRFGKPWLLPVGAVAGAALFYAALLAFNVSVDEARSLGFLLGPFPEGGAWQPPSAALLSQIQWAVLPGQVGNLLVLVAVGAIALLLNAAGLELVYKRDLDLDRELRAAGVANLISGAGGGMSGFHTLSLSSLTHQSGAKSRLVAIVSAAVCVVVLLAGTRFVSFFPAPILAGLLMTLGLSFLVEWLVDARSDLTWAEYIVLLVIVVIIGLFGFLQGVVVGLLGAAILFIINYSRVNVVKHTLTGANYASTVDRPEAHRTLLRQQGERLYVLKLQGYIFFGTANGILEVVKERVEESERPEPRFVILDLRLVTGLDSSVLLSLSRLLQMAEERDFHLLFTDPTPQMESSLERELRPEDDEDRLHIFSDLDHGVEWCEGQILAASEKQLEKQAEGLEQLLARVLPEHVEPARLIAYMDRQEVPAGAYLVRQGDAPDVLYFIESGRVTVQLEIEGDEPLRLRTMEYGNVVGEMGMYLNIERSASVVADEACVVYSLTADDLTQMEDKDPQVAAAFHRFVVRLLADRLVDSNQLAAALLD